MTVVRIPHAAERGRRRPRHVEGARRDDPRAPRRPRRAPSGARVADPRERRDRTVRQRLPPWGGRENARRSRHRRHRGRHRHPAAGDGRRRPHAAARGGRRGRKPRPAAPRPAPSRVTPTVQPRAPVAASLLDLVGGTPLVELRRHAPQAGRVDLREARGRTHRIDQGQGREVDDRGGGGLRRARARARPARAHVRQHRDLARAGGRAQGLPAHLRDAGGARPRSGAGSSGSTAPTSSRRPPRRARTAPSASRSRWLRTTHGGSSRSSTRGSQPARTTEGCRRRDRGRARPGRRAGRQGLGTGGTLMGAGRRLREAFPDVVVAAAEPLPGDPVMGLRSLEGRLRAADPRRGPARPEAARLERGIRCRDAGLSCARGILAGVSAGAAVHVARRLAVGSTRASS